MAKLSISVNGGVPTNIFVEDAQPDETGPRKHVKIANGGMIVMLGMMTPVDLMRVGEFLTRESGLQGDGR